MSTKRLMIFCLGAVLLAGLGLAVYPKLRTPEPAPAPTPPVEKKETPAVPKKGTLEKPSLNPPKAPLPTQTSLPQLGPKQGDKAFPPMAERIDPGLPTADPAGGLVVPPAVPGSASTNMVIATLNASQMQALKGLQALLDQGSDSVDEVLDPLRDWADGNPAESAQWVADNLQGSARELALEEVIGIWSDKSPLDALNWLDKNSGLPGAASAYNSAVASLARSNAPAAADWLKNHPAQNTQDNWEVVLSPWGKTNQAEALRWIVANPLAPGLSDSLLPTMLASFQDSASTETLLQSGSTVAKDPALAEAAQMTSFENPEFALGLAQRIQDPSVRLRMQNSVLTDWMEVNPTAASAYASQNQLPLPSGK